MWNEFLILILIMELASSVQEISPDNARKRIACPETWQRAVDKRQRYSAASLPQYPDCNHRRHYVCSLLTMNDIQKFHAAYYSTPEKAKQDAFLLKFCRRNSPNPKRKIQNAQKGKRDIFEYTILNAIGNHMLVCRRAFLRVLAISKHRVLGVFQRFKKNEAPVSIETRGGDRKTELFAPKKDAVKRFICSLKAHESHYTRERSHRIFLPSELNITIVWKMYNQDIRPLEEHVKLSYFRTIFCTSFYIGFSAPTVDQCSKCIQFDHKIAIETDLVKKAELQFQRAFHKKQADAFFEHLRRKPEDCFLLSFDCQRNLVLPKVPDQIAYYTRQLYCYNLSVVRGISKDNLNPHNVSIYSWTENEAKKGSNEVASIVFNELTHCHDFTGFTKVRLVADGCPGQNKNVYVLTMCATWLARYAPANIKELEVVYPVTGYSFLPCDRVFGYIERVVKKRTTILTREKYHDIFQRFGTLKRIGPHWTVFDWKTGGKEKMKSATQLHFHIASCKRIIFRKTKSNAVVVSGELVYNSNIACERPISKKNVSVFEVNPSDIPIGVPVNPQKLAAVQKLLTAHFGSEWQDYKKLEWYKKLTIPAILTR